MEAGHNMSKAERKFNRGDLKGYQEKEAIPNAMIPGINSLPIRSLSPSEKMLDEQQLRMSKIQQKAARLDQTRMSMGNSTAPVSPTNENKLKLQNASSVHESHNPITNPQNVNANPYI